MNETNRSEKHYDMVVIGSGAAGHHGAIQAAKLGKKVAVVERSIALGGASINTGTIPSKTLREAVLRSTRSGSTDRRISASKLALRIEEVASNEVRVFENQFRRNDIDVLTGTASFSGPHTIRVANQEGAYLFHADHVLIAAGSRPAHNDAIPVDDVSIIDTDAIRRLRTEHHVLTIVVIGIEYACIAAALDVQVTVIERRPRILDFVDQQIVEALSYHMRSQGVIFRLGEEVEEVTKSSEGKVCAKLKSGKEIWSDALLYAVGRQANTDSLNLAACELAADARGRIQVNANFQTSQPHIYAAGDVIGFPSLSSVAMEQGRVAVCHAFGVQVVSVPELVPLRNLLDSGDFVRWQTEEQLTEAGVSYEFGIAHYREIARGQILNDTTGLLKILFHRETRQLLGVHIVGEGATELIHIGQAVIGFEGTIDSLINTVFNYPTLAECYKVAALNGLNRINYSSEPSLNR